MSSTHGTHRSPVHSINRSPGVPLPMTRRLSAGETGLRIRLRRRARPATIASVFVNPTPSSSGPAELLQTPESWLPNEHSLYRPRHSRRQRTALTCGLVFFFVPVLLLAVGV